MNYLFNRWVFSRKFKRADEGYLYHKWLGSGGVPVSVEERDECLRLYRHRYWRLVGWGFGAFSLGALLFAFLAVFLEQPSSGAFIQYGTYALIGVFAAWMIIAFQQLAAIPKQVFGERLAAIADEGWLAGWRLAMKKRSWPVHILVTALMGALVWFGFPPSTGMGVWGWLWWLFFVALLGISIAGMWLKSQPDP